jgi:hypothetical protein
VNKLLLTAAALVMLTTSPQAATVMIGTELPYVTPPPPYIFNMVTSGQSPISYSGSIGDWTISITASTSGINTTSNLTVSNSNTTTEDWLNVAVYVRDIVNPVNAYQDRMTLNSSIAGRSSVWFTTYADITNSVGALNGLYSAGGPLLMGDPAIATMLFDASYPMGSCNPCSIADVYVIQSHPISSSPQLTPVPLPASVLLFASALAGVAALSRRRLKRASLL